MTAVVAQPVPAPDAEQAPGARDLRACYVLLEYPVLTQTFVSDEIEALRAKGATVVTVSLEGAPGADIALAQHRTRDWWTLRRFASFAVRHPRATAAALRRPALSFGLRIKLLAAARDAAKAGVNAVHAHFAYRSADAAEVIGTALGTGHSLTAHARDLFVPSGDVAHRLAAARTIVTVCDYNRRWLLEHHGEAVAAKTVVVPCSTRVDRSRGARVDDRPLARPLPKIAAAGRLVPKKGLDVLIDACRRLTSPFELVIVGDGPERAALQGQIEATGLNAVVHLVGARPHATVLDVIAGADVFCMPFRIAPDGDRDSMPVVVKEAMAAGVAVVSTDVVGVPEMVVHGETGLLVDPDDPDALAGALDLLLADSELRSHMGRRGRAVVEERFDLRHQAQALVEVLTCASA